MNFRVLGPPDFRIGSAEVAIARREWTLLATLLLHANRTVSLQRIADAVWGDRPPQDSTGQIHSCVYRLRRRLAAAGAPGELVVTHPAGYEARIDPQELDLTKFRELRDQAQAAAARGEQEVAGTRYRAALDLWRGSALEGLDSEVLRQAATALDEEHLQALEQCIDIELALDRAGELIPEITNLVRQHPYRETLHSKRMLALHLVGRQADALAAFRHVRKIMHDELGIEPGPELQRLHQAILNRDPALGPPRPPEAAEHTGGRSPTPRELPVAVSGFTGRVHALKALDEMLAAGVEAAPGSVVISAIAGTAGIGKTALAVHWGHKVADQFSDGQLYLNLRGYDAGPPLPTIDALTAILRSLGTPPDQIPTDEAQAAARYRSQLAGRRLLVMLDNAGSIDQVRSLLPGSEGCMALVTSRDRLAGLVARDGARRITLDVLPPDEAFALLAQLLGDRRVDAEPDATEALSHACAYLPLALRIAAASLIDLPYGSIAEYVAELTGGDRLALLVADGDQESAVRATFDLSYQPTPAKAQRLFRLLGLVPGWDVTTAAAAALFGATVDEVKPLLTTLAGAHLINEHSPGRYTFHDLLRLYARQLAETDEERAQAVERLVTWYLHTTNRAVTSLYGALLQLPAAETATALPRVAFSEPAAALEWLDTERANLVVTINQVAGAGPRRAAWLLTDCLRAYLRRGRHVTEWLSCARAAMDAAEQMSDPFGQATAHLCLADAYDSTTNYEQSIEHYTVGLTIAHQVAWPDGQFRALNNLGNIYKKIGLYQEAADHYRKASAAWQLAGHSNPGIEANISNNLGVIAEELGQLRRAAEHHAQALSQYRLAGSVGGEANALYNRGLVNYQLGEFDDASDGLAKALARYQEAGDRPGEIASQDKLIWVQRDSGHLTEALERAESNAAKALEVGDQTVLAEALNTLGSVRLRLGHPWRALESLRQAFEISSQAGVRLLRIESQLGLAAAELGVGTLDEAATHVFHALALAREAGSRVLEGQASTLLAQIHVRQGEHDQALDYANYALSNHRETGHRLGEARTLVILGHLLAKDDPEAANRRWRRAGELFAEMGGQPPEALPQLSGGGRG